MTPSAATGSAARPPAALAGLRMPAEWEPHVSTWIGWPHHEPDWPGKLAPIPWVYAEIVRVLAAHERVDICCHSVPVMEDARHHLSAHGVDASSYQLHLVPSDRVWLRDSGAATVVDAAGTASLIHWQFTGWAKYENHALDAGVGEAMARITGLPRHEPQRPDGHGRVVLEGGAIDVNGAGRLLTTEECLLSTLQERNPGLDRAGYERVFAQWLGIHEVLWLGNGCVGDDTHGHVDDIARFTSVDTVVLSYEADPDDANHAASVDNLRRLQLAGGEAGTLRVITLPYPRPVMMDGVRLPASYANFYVANGVVIVPTFNDPTDRHALNTLASLFPDRAIVGIHAVDLVWGLGTLHCLSQQQSRGRRSP